MGPEGGAGSRAPHLMTIDGVRQVLLMRGARTTSVSPADGTMLWEHGWRILNASILQPARTSNGDILLAAGDAMAQIGMRRIAVKRGAGAWTIEERWTSRGLKPFYNDFVVARSCTFGFDGSILACIDLRGRQPEVEGRTLRARADGASAGTGPAAGDLGGG